MKQRCLKILLGLIAFLAILLPGSVFADYETHLIGSPNISVNYQITNIPKGNVGNLESQVGTSGRVGYPSAIGGGIMGITFNLRLKGDGVENRTLNYAITHNDVSTLAPDHGTVTTDGNGYAEISTLAPSVGEEGGNSFTRTIRFSGTENDQLDSNMTYEITAHCDGTYADASASGKIGHSSSLTCSYNGSIYDPTTNIDVSANLPITINYVDQSGKSVNESKDFTLTVTRGTGTKEGPLESTFSFGVAQPIHYSGQPVHINIPLQFKGGGSYYFSAVLKDGNTQVASQSRCFYVSQEDQDYTVDSFDKNAKDASINLKVTKAGEQTPTTPSQPITVKVSSISVTPSSVNLEVEGSQRLSASVSPSNATNKNVNWSTSNGSIASVDDSGNVKAVGAGTAHITATAADGSGASGSCTVIVKSKTPTEVAPTGVSLSVGGVTLEVGGTYTINATVEPVEAKNKTVTWKSENTNIATITQDGKITAVAPGYATISATTSNGKVAKCVVTVNKKPEGQETIKVEGITLNKNSLTINAGSSEILTATVLPANATNKNVTWSSNNPSVAALSGDGKVVAYKKGEATITATSSNPEKKAICTVTVEDHSVKNVKVESVSLKPTSAQIRVGETLTLNETVNPENAEDRSTYWYSTDDSVATVNENGIVTAVGIGNCNIVVSTNDGNKQAKCNLQVINNEEVVVTPAPEKDPSGSDNPGTVDPGQNPQPTPNPDTSSDSNPTETPEQTTKASNIYRMYNPITGEHLYTSDANEAKILAAQHGWNSENVGWESPSTGTPVYRLFNPGINDHLYTSDANEVKVLTEQQGWQADNNAKPIFYSGGNVPIYRLYNPGTQRHHLTKDVNEYNSLAQNGWKQEGVAIKAIG